MYLVGSFRTTPSLSDTGRATIESQSSDVSDNARDSRKTSRSESSSLGTAAVLSGRALLTTGESVRSLDSRGLRAGDRIQTDGEGRATVDLANDSGKMQVEPESDVAIGEVENAPSGSPRLDLRVGNIWVQVKDPTLEVTSPLAQVTASEGAMYHLRITLNATTILSVHGGTVWVQAKNGGGLHVLGLGERLRIEPGGDVNRDRHIEVSKWIEKE